MLEAQRAEKERQGRLAAEQRVEKERREKEELQREHAKLMAELATLKGEKQQRTAAAPLPTSSSLAQASDNRTPLNSSLVGPATTMRLVPRLNLQKAAEWI